MKFTNVQLFGILIALLICVTSIDKTAANKDDDETIVINNKQDLVKYLQKMNDMYGISGRSRFGKRAPLSNNYRSSASIYDQDDDDLKVKLPLYLSLLQILKNNDRK
jgi:hypothetical protein